MPHRVTTLSALATRGIKQMREKQIPAEAAITRRKALKPLDPVNRETSRRSGRLTGSDDLDGFIVPDDEPRRSSRPKVPKELDLDERGSGHRAIDKWSDHHDSYKKLLPMMYPLTGPKRTEITADDIPRLDDDEFLNDSLINFWLRKLELAHPEREKSVYFFNTFFFDTLSGKNSRDGRKGFSYDAVKRWTKKVDLFSYDYVLVPVNLSFHWFIAIVCNLRSISRSKPVLDDALIESSPADVTVSPDEDSTIPMEQATETADAAQDIEELDMPVESLPERPKPRKSGVFEVPDSDEVPSKTQDASVLRDNTLDLEGVDIPISSGRVAKPTKLSRVRQVPKKKFDPNKPCIITLDSFGTSRHGPAGLLKDYLVAEAMDKRQLSIEKGDFVAINAQKVPGQTNTTDCGVFALGYAEAFLNNPSKFVGLLCSREDPREAFEDFDETWPSRKRAEMRDTVLKIAEEQQVKRDAVDSEQEQVPSSTHDVL